MLSNVVQSCFRNIYALLSLLALVVLVICRIEKQRPNISALGESTLKNIAPHLSFYELLYILLSLKKMKNITYDERKPNKRCAETDYKMFRTHAVVMRAWVLTQQHNTAKFCIPIQKQKTSLHFFTEFLTYACKVVHAYVYM